ncbi:Rhicadhesin receptor [Apostasia shenzhenica]|uniref:Germin-like protein n=1 Tax=Apostasia shenzhenica TaxID=1088818 RepID=A0A2I0AAV3_9ASPA|nr:Rhicadhesin receptor [Apostasia shenzhenica]
MIDGFACKPADKVAETDFFFAGLAGTKPSAAAAPLGSAVTAGDVLAIPGLNTLGISMSRIDYAAAGGLNPPHLHPRASEILFVIAGRLEVGFITAAGKLVSKTVSKGQVFVFPQGLMHFERNKDDVLATAIAAFDSELPGTQRVPVALFAAVPPVADFVLARAFGLETEVVKKIEAGITPKN